MSRLLLREHCYIRLVTLIIVILSLTSCSGIGAGLHSVIALKLAIRDFNNGKYNTAIKHFDKVINNLPANPENDKEPSGTAFFYYCRGLAYIKNGDCSKGFIDLQKASELVEESYKRDSFDEGALKKLSTDISTARQLCNK